MALGADVKAQIKLLEKARTKRELTDEEKIVLEKLKKDMIDYEGFISKEVKKIEKEL